MQYELTIVLDGNATSAKKKAVLEKIAKLVKTHEGKVVKEEDWGKKDLAYRIKKALTGQYLYFELELEKDKVKAFSTLVGRLEEVIRYLLVKKE